MEIKACEQYVLDQLMCTKNEVYSLRAAIDEWKARCAKLEAELKARDERDASEVEQAIIKEGRAKLYRNGSSYRTSVDGGGKLMPFEDWFRGWGEEPFELEGLDGVTTAVRGKGCVIWVSKKIKGHDLYGLAAHEATHAACDMLDMIGEDEPAPEELAYMVQSITTGIIIACEGA